MKKYLLGLFTLFAITTVAFAGENWVKFDDNTYLDHSAIKKVDNNSYRIKMKIINKMKNNPDNMDFGYTVIEEVIDCDKNLLIPEHLALYNSKGELIVKRNKKEINVKSQEIKPEFTEAKIKPQVCSGEFSKKTK